MWQVNHIFDVPKMGRGGEPILPSDDCHFTVLPRFSLYGVAPRSRNCSQKILFMSGLLFWVRALFLRFLVDVFLFSCVSGFCQGIFLLFRAFVFFRVFFSFFSSSLLLLVLGLARVSFLSLPSAACRRATSTGRSDAA